MKVIHKDKNTSKARSCVGKIPYKNAGKASNSVKSLQEKNKLHGIPVIYLCKFCSKWHIGTKPRSRDRMTRINSAIDRALRADERIKSSIAKRNQNEQSKLH